MEPTYTPEVQAKLVAYLSTHRLPAGLGDEEAACSIAAINLAFSGELTDAIPDCMSEVLGRATIGLQDAMPSDVRNSARYKAWLPTAVGTGRDREQERLDVLLDWMWKDVLPRLQGLADDDGFGDEWRRMSEDRGEDAANAAHAAADATYANYANSANYADYAAAGAAAYAAARAAAYAAARAAAASASYAADAAGDAANAAGDAANAAGADFWLAVDPIGVLERMTAIE